MNEIEIIGSSPNNERLVLGCIEAEFCKQIVNTRWEALDEIYKIYVLLHSSDLKMSVREQKVFQHVGDFF